MVAHVPGREEVLLDVKGDAAGTALADEADEEEAFEMMAANCKEMGKWKERKTKTTCQNIFPSGKSLIPLLAATQ